MIKSIHWESRKSVFTEDTYRIRHMIGFYYIGSQSGVIMSEVAQLGKAECYRIEYRQRKHKFKRCAKPYNFDTLEEAKERITQLNKVF